MGVCVLHMCLPVQLEGSSHKGSFCERQGAWKTVSTALVSMAAQLVTKKQLKQFFTLSKPVGFYYM